MKKVDELKSQSMRILGNSIRARRIKQNISIDELAMRSNVHRTTISAIELGKKDPTSFTLLKIAAGLRLDNSLELLHDSNHSVYHAIRELAKEWE